MIFKIIALVLFALFYSVYILKMLIQRKKGIKTDQIASGEKEQKIIVTELIMKIATYCVAIFEVVSVLFIPSASADIMKIVGAVIAGIGVSMFMLSVYTMKDSWRAGIAVDDETKIITGGIYSYSRNPAFLGFYLHYIGLLLMIFNLCLFVLTVFAIIMLHIQILNEEKFLSKKFGDEYLQYRRRVRRYIGKR